VVDRRARLHLELAVELVQRRIELEWNARSGGLQSASDVKALAVEASAVGDEAHTRVRLDVEEVLGAQVDAGTCWST
jgi:hypothetical protein